MITAFVFLTFGVSATTYTPTTYNTFQDSVTYNGLTYFVRVTQLKAQSTGTSLLEAGQQTTMLVTLQLTNNNNSTVACTIPKLTIDCSDERVITGVDTYGGDITLSLLSGGIGVFLPNEEFSYQNNKIIVPANTSLYCVGAIYLPAKLNQDGSGVLDTGLRGAHLYDKSNYQVTIGDYSYGTPINLSSVISAIEDLADTVSTSAEMQSLINAVTYSGNAFASSITSGVRYVLDNTRNNIRLLMTVYTGYPVYSTLDNYYNGSNDNILTSGTIKYPFFIKVQITNSNNIGKKVYYAHLLKNVFPTANTSLHIEYFDSNYYSSFNRITAPAGIDLVVNDRYKISNDRSCVLPVGTSYVMITGYTELPYGTTATFNDINQNGFDYYFNNSSFSDVSGYYPLDEYTILKDLYLAYSTVNGINDSSDLSNDVADVSDSNHIIEESYYSANASAIEATGLSNYHFSNEQNNGIGSVSNDFMLLWNALGSWNGVYIFSLTMALATFIMRHGGLFTVKKEVSDKGGEGD